MVRNEIALLSKDTIDKIAAGEVVERPASVVKELVENAIDAGSDAITVEIKEGGTTFIRITDNGCGIPKDEIPLAFLRHSTSKIRSAEDLKEIQSLGFRGEALSSISAVSRVELITKTQEELTGVRYIMEGASEVSCEEIGAPCGTTFLIYQLFYNTPVRKKFLKSPATEGGYIQDLMERLALSHPSIAFRFINNGQEKINTSGNGNLKDMIYQIYGREITSHLLEVHQEFADVTIDGYIGKPMISRGNRNMENFFVQQRFIKSKILSKAVEDGYKGYLMQHQYPFVVLNLTFHGAYVDVNIHPTKQEVRFEDDSDIYQKIYQMIHNRLEQREGIEQVPVAPPEKEAALPKKEMGPEPFEQQRRNAMKTSMVAEAVAWKPSVTTPESSGVDVISKSTEKAYSDTVEHSPYIGTSMDEPQEKDAYIQQELSQLQPEFLSKEAKEQYHMIGQLFDTYWLIQYEDSLYIIDQHAAHEKVLYEHTMRSLRNKEMTTQLISPPMIITLNAMEQQVLHRYQDAFCDLGYVITEFGGKEYSISGIPGNLFNIDAKELFMNILAECSDLKAIDSYELILEKVASMSCKAAVKGNQKLSQKEVEALIDELLTLDNPYHCPHGRPTIISMSRYEIEKKFKRIV